MFVGPVRSARIGDLDLLSAMNRPVFAYSGANPGVTDWINSAARSGVLVDFTALHNPCLHPHGRPARAAQPVARPELRRQHLALRRARPDHCGKIDSSWTPPNDIAVIADTTFTLAMDGVDSRLDVGQHGRDRTCDLKTASRI